MDQHEIDEVTAAANAAIAAAAKEKVDSLAAMPLRLPMPAVVVLVTLMLGGVAFCWNTWGQKTGMIVGGGGVLLLVALQVGYALKNMPMMPYAPMGTLSWEAQLSLSPLSATLERKIAQLGSKPTPEEVAELAFLARQVHVMLDVVKRGQGARGRGYVGFDAYGADQNTWQL